MRFLERKSDGELSLTEYTDKDAANNSEEVNFQDLEAGTGKGKAGWKKIEFCADQAAVDGLRYSWVDTCCIDRKNAVELSEAINSMFRWYQKAARCYVYLPDVSVVDHRGNDQRSHLDWEVAFRQSRWFTRGWTLQELIAPAIVQFFSKEGELLGDKESLKQQICEITGIPLDDLSETPLSSFSVEARMQWAARRKTTRKEDGAYCLLGIFDVFIPPIYGEGEYAFVRLQEAINNKSERRVERGRVDVHNGGSDRSLPQAGQPFGLRPTNSKRERPFPKQEKARENFLNSLIFEHIEDRYNNIKLAHSATCQWLLTNENYRSWKDKKQVCHHHGLLWLKGKPGAGKSTIIKFALTEAKRSRMEDIHISFFFNARGSLLEKDTRGMYRSLLFQLLTKLPQAREVFDDFDILELPRAPSYSWTIIQLKAVLNRAIQELGERWLWIYVDALDECDEDQIRDMVVFFDLLGQHTVTSDINMRVFFASRYYPRIITPKKVELRLEDEEEHSRDIERYIQGELRTGRDTQSTRIEWIRGEIKRRASGVFIWVVLVVQILNKAYDHGRILGLEKRLQEIPDDLGQLFRGIITRDGRNMESMRLCIQWVLFAKRPLTREELYFAIYSGTAPEEVGTWNFEGITTEVMDAFILSCSKGLVELTQSRKPTVQFIHETIRDFLLKENGMQYIQGTSTQSLVGSGHNSLKQCCVNYVSSAQELLSSSPPVNSNSIDSWQMDFAKLPFIGYALSYIFHHANASQANGVSQAFFFKEFSIQHWIHLTKRFSEPGTMQVSEPRLNSITRYSPDLSLLNILVQENLPSLIEMVLEIDPQADIEGSIHDSPLRTALKHMHYDSLGALLTPPRAQNSVSRPASLLRHPNRSELDSLIGAYYFCSREGISAESILCLYFQWGTQSDVSVLLRSGRFRSDANISAAMQRSPLSFAAERGYEDVAKSLLDQPDVDPNLQDYLGLTPLSRAIRDGRLNVVSLLLQSTQIDINLQCSTGRSPLSYAAESGYEDIFKLILYHPGVGVNSRDWKGRTPFFYAAMRGREGIIRLLINFTGVDIKSRDSIGHTALSYAVMNGHEGVVRQLLDTSKVDVNSRDTIHGRTPLLFALEYGYKTIAKLLLDEPDIDVHLPNNRGRTPLAYALDKGMYEAAEIISLRTQERREKVLEEEPSVTLTSFSNLASVLQD